MLEEEKKAIDYLKFYVQRDMMYENTHYEQITLVLKLVEKQQKELKELKDKIKEIIYPTPENYISIEVQQSEMYKKLLKEVEG